ncbi:hypothetical protein VNO80_28503 [Phaseolus coccineus]|uniref:Uncharacterized protein n=1 Tax=Phaseolus coccineus TaxID=3886 RepID=A0AAN9LEB5_PHACN
MVLMASQSLSAQWFPFLKLGSFHGRQEEGMKSSFALRLGFALSIPFLLFSLGSDCHLGQRRLHTRMLRYICYYIYKKKVAKHSLCFRALRNPRRSAHRRFSLCAF